MAAIPANATDNPEAIQNLDEGKLYYAERVGPVRVYLDVTDIAPAASDAPGFEVPDADHGGKFFELGAGESAYVWTAAGNGRIVYDEAPA